MALVRKILEATLTAGSTSVTFTDTDIPNSLLRVYCTKASLFPLSQTLSGNSLSVNYKPQDANVGVALEIVKQGLDIVDNVTSTDTDKALSANQGYVLKDLIDNIVIPTVPENITDLDDVSVSSIQNGQVLAWNSVSEKFENVNQSGGGSNNTYSNDEVVIGAWMDKPLYRKVITVSGFNSSMLVGGNIYHGSVTISDYISDVSKLFGVADKSFIDVGSNSYRGFLSILSEDDAVLDCYTVYARSGSATITVEYTKSTD